MLWDLALAGCRDTGQRAAPALHAAGASASWESLPGAQAPLQGAGGEPRPRLERALAQSKDGSHDENPPSPCIEGLLCPLQVSAPEII